jgi:hypothetical protein
MATTSAPHPYYELFEQIVAIAKRPKGWNSYDADVAIPTALIGVVELINSFRLLSTIVPIPSVGLSPDGAVVLRWLTSEYEIELAYRALHAGEYTVLRRGTGDTIKEGSLSELDPLKDLVDTFVVRPLRQHQSWH